VVGVWWGGGCGGILQNQLKIFKIISSLQKKYILNYLGKTYINLYIALNRPVKGGNTFSTRVSWL